MCDSKNYSFFQHKECECFPCHAGLEKENMEEKDFNCIFCYCPLYALGDQCGGNFNYDNEDEIKDCSGCLLPHKRQSYNYITEKCKLLCNMAKKTKE